MKHIVEEMGDYYGRGSVVLGSSTVSRVAEDQPDPSFKRRAVGFTAPLAPARTDPPEGVDPLLWDGDDS